MFETTRLRKRLTGNCLQIWLFVLACGVYGNTLFNSYGFDDSLVTTPENKLVQKGVSGIPEIFTSYYLNWNGYKADYRPLVKLTYALEYELYGFNPGISHLINVVLFGLTAIFLFQFLCLLFTDKQRFLVFLAVCLFCIHPINTEVVASLKSRDELLSLLFTVLSFIYVAKFFRTQSRKSIAIAACFYLFSMLSKMSSISWIPVLLAGLHFYLGVPRSKVLWTGLVIVCFTLMFYGVVFTVFNDWTRPFTFVETPFHFLPTSEKWASIVAASGYYLKLLVWPHPMCCYYGFDQIPSANWSDFRVYGAVLGYTGMVALAIYQLPRKGFAGLGSVIILADVALFLNVQFPYVGIVSDRVLYGSSLGISLIIVAAAMRFSQEKSSGVAKSSFSTTKLLVPLLFIAVAGGTLTINRNVDWHDNLTLFSHDAKTCSQSAKIQQLYAHHLRQEYLDNPAVFSEQKAQKALSVYERSISIYDQWPITLYGAGNVWFFDLNNPEKALPYYEKAVSLNPDFTDANYDLLNTYLAVRDFEKAEKTMTGLVEKFPEDETLFGRVLRELFKENRLQQAEGINQRFLKKFPHLESPYIYQGNFLLSRRDTVGALKYYEKALSINPSYTEFNDYVNQLYQEIGVNRKLN